MIASANEKLIVSVDYSQKESMEISGTKILLAKEYSTNRRESMPVVCTVLTGNEYVVEGIRLLVHHNRFKEDSPHHLGDNLFSLAYNPSIFAWIDKDGGAHQMCGNVIVERIYDNDSPIIPDHLKKYNPHKFKVVSNGCGFMKGQYVFAYEFSDYEIVYMFRGKEYRVIKIYKDDIVGKVINNSREIKNN